MEGDAGAGTQGRFRPRSPRGIVRIHRDRVHSVATAGSKFASASWDGTVKIYDLTSDKPVKTLGTQRNRWNNFVKSPHHQARQGDTVMNGLYAVAFAKTHSDILGCASGTDEHGSGGTVHVFNYETGERLLQISDHDGDTNSVDFHSHQDILVTGSDDCTARIWDFHEGKELRRLVDHEREVYASIFLGGGMEYNVATCSFDTLVRIFDMRGPNVVQEFKFHSDDVIGLDYAEQTGVLATGGDDGLIGLFDVRTWQRLQFVNTRLGHEGCEVKRVALDASGSMLAAACSTCTVLVYDLQSDSSGSLKVQEVAELDGHEDCVFDVAWSTEVVRGTSRRVLVSACHDATSRVWVEQ